SNVYLAWQPLFLVAWGRYGTRKGGTAGFNRLRIKRLRNGPRQLGTAKNQKRCRMVCGLLFRRQSQKTFASKTPSESMPNDVKTTPNEIREASKHSPKHSQVGSLGSEPSTSVRASKE